MSPLFTLFAGGRCSTNQPSQFSLRQSHGQLSAAPSAKPSVPSRKNTNTRPTDTTVSNSTCGGLPRNLRTCFPWAGMPVHDVRDSRLARTADEAGSGETTVFLESEDEERISMEGLVNQEGKSNQRHPDLLKHRSMDKYQSKDTLVAIFCFLGLTGSLMVYGVLQERIMTIPFGHEGRRFRHSLFLVLCNRFVACGFAFFYSFLAGGRTEPIAPLNGYATVSVANVIASTCQYEALKYVSFPVQVLAKCTKMIPVMIWQTLISRKVYTVREYLQALVVAGGCAVFLLTGTVTSGNVQSTASGIHSAYVLGGVTIVGYLAVDGFTSTWQDRLFSGYDMDLCNQVLYTSMFSMALSTLGLCVFGNMWDALRFVADHPDVWAWIWGISIASASVQFFVSYTIKTYGALVFATVMTTRQWFSILLSCLIFAHPLSKGQWLGTLLVFGSLYHKFYSRRPKTPHQVQS